MKLGVGLPNTMPLETDRALMLDSARLADQAAGEDRQGGGGLRGCGRRARPLPADPRLDQVEQLAEHVLPAYR
jgi:hypothetical protein